MASNSDLSVQLLFSEGSRSGGIGVMEVWELYSLPFFAYALGIPAGNVTMFATEALRNAPDSSLEVARSNVCNSSDGPTNYFPESYFKYFAEVYRNMDQDMSGVAATGPCSFRVVLGHGYGNYEGGNLYCGGIVRYESLGHHIPEVLSVLDIGNSAYAVAGLLKAYPPIGGPKKFKRQKFAASDAAAVAPTACEQRDSTYAFRVGYVGQNEDPHARSEHPREFIGMSNVFGQSVAFSVLWAVKTFVEKDMEGDLSELFKEKFLSLRRNFLENADPPKPHGDLSKLQSLIMDGTIRPNMDAFDCVLFDRHNEWYLTFERDLVLCDGQDELAKQVIDFLTQSIVHWHNGHPDAVEVPAKSIAAWDAIVHALGVYGVIFKKKQFEFDDKSGKLVPCDEGNSMEELATSCIALPDYFAEASRMITSGGVSE